MTANKKELAVAALRNGTVIDHIPSEALFAAVKILGIENLEKSITKSFAVKIIAYRNAFF